jgi:hypothetical protein
MAAQEHLGVNYVSDEAVGAGLQPKLAQERGLQIENRVLPVPEGDGGFVPDSRADEIDRHEPLHTEFVGPPALPLKVDVAHTSGLPRHRRAEQDAGRQSAQLGHK